MKQSVARVLHALMIAAGVGAVGSLAKVLPEVIPPVYAGLAMVALQALQALLGDHAYTVNWDGTPARVAAAPKP